MKSLLCKFGFHKWKDLTFGYPKYSKWPKTYSRCVRCKRQKIETHNLFGQPRSPDLDIKKDYIVDLNKPQEFHDKAKIG